MLAGDFNILSCPQESSDFNGSQGVTGAMREFKDCQEGLDVIDHPFIGSFFTWCNYRDDDPLSRKLDRVLINQAWLTGFPCSLVEFLVPDCSDHCPSYVVLRAPLVKLPRLFKFFNFWTRHPNFLAIMEESWKLPASGNPLQVLLTKLKRLKKPLKKLNKEAYGDISNRVFIKQVELANQQKDLMANPTTDCIERKKVAARQKANTIIVLHDDQGQRFDTFDGISNELVQFFSNSLGTIDPEVNLVSDVLLKDILRVELTPEMGDSLVAPVTHKEIRDVIFAMNGNKAHGPDGYFAKFFQ
ncbi:hypothetical protein V6N13_135230 [Hibiscus sabdariffa]